MPVDVTVLICAHNEEAYVRKSLEGILRQSIPPARIILVADRCTDDTVAVSKGILPKNSIVIEKRKKLWKNSYAESLEIGRKNAVGEVLAIVDADILVPTSFLEKTSASCAEWASVSALVRTDPSQGLMNYFVSFWERSYLFAPLGREARGGARSISMRALAEVAGFRDVIAPDTDLDIRLKKHGEKVKMDTSLVALHLRKMSLARSVFYQIKAGEARSQLGVSLLRTLLHSILRLRPFVVYGYLKTQIGKDKPRRGDHLERRRKT
ncbi:glycosyltransferase [Candidatus Bathyarchaeota archaeon]|nr:MAG: glycosyltransferase [Candidatus Bathyarchaeota archaeon]